MKNRFAYSILLTGLVIGSFRLGYAQSGPGGAILQLPPSPGSAVVTSQMGSGGMGFQFVSAEPAFSTRVVKGAPYSLEATIDMVQTLSDGNRIVHRQVVRVFRDSEGRTRREETLAAIGPWAASGTPPTIVTIQDPVAGVNYSLDPQNKVATKLPSALGGKTAGFVSVQSAGRENAIFKSSVPVSSMAAAPSVGFSAVAGGFNTAEGETGVVVVGNGMPGKMLTPEEDSESLGKEAIAGVSADGTRTSTTIPANTIGNERPLEISRERWYSPELQIVLRSKQSDPRFGETTYEVTTLDRGKPAHALFEVPSDYQVRDAPVFLTPGPAPK